MADSKDEAKDILMDSPTFESDTPEFADWFLQQIVAFANMGLEIGITLTVEGVTITGTLIGGKTYFEELSKLVEDASGENNEVGKTLGKLWRENTSLYEDAAGQTEEQSVPFLPPAFIHLRAAQIISPDGARLPAGNGYLWRGRVTAVSGFAIGKLEQS